MAKTASLNMRIDPNVKKAAAELFSRFGITVSDAVNIFLHKAIMTGGMPFNMMTAPPASASKNEEQSYTDDKTMAKIYESLAELTAEFDAELVKK